MKDWQSRARQLTGQLAEGGALRSEPWRAAFAATPRHEFVPAYYEQNPDGTWREINADLDRDTWLTAVYSDETLITALTDSVNGHGNDRRAVSSSTQPSLMARMLEALDVRDGHHVLEIGTGTGYNAALLCHRLGDSRVHSVDIDHHLVEAAQQRLTRVGYLPTLRAWDGARGLAEHGPYDRIIATCAVPAVPYAWVDQLRGAGAILVDVKPATMGGNLVLLHRDGDQAVGRFLPGWAGFMQMRHSTASEEARRLPRPDRSESVSRVASVPAVPWEAPVPWFLATRTMPVGVTFGQRWDEHTQQVGDTYLAAPDGSWCEISAEDEHGKRRVWEGGPVSIVGAIEEAYRLWHDLDEPGWDQLGLTVTPHEQYVWLNDPASPHRWPVA
ncbi:methyltransferase domain-containing protein [Goodfellowiella coeruleoviolacea]|uniref:Protein-L-isoaspartate O-methyltransferase n=1 Tax=Goodfellowiella coeruleoviolacea TaxID=334858 RepID=A0AAE3GGR5_9PSEU|nr:methyltransferase domain-containing protein [Goodfellowiella coeruleoviolacea]MCP2167055.1 methyltransferase, ATP-grasp peptide maturase system [Goodfellowiella coeruleoviolacea]